MGWPSGPYGRALAAGELSLVLPLGINALTAGAAFSAGWLLGGAVPPSASSAGVACLVLGALLLGRRGRPLGSSLVQSPGCTGRCCWLSASGVVGSQLSTSSAFKPAAAWLGGVVSTLAVALPLLTPAVFPGPRPMAASHGWNPGGQALATRHCWHCLALLLGLRV